MHCHHAVQEVEIEENLACLSQPLSSPLVLSLPPPFWVSDVLADEKPEASNADAAATFAQLDANKDGQLSADEIRAENKRLFERLLRTADKNKDARLSLEEFSAGLAPEDRAKADNPGGENDERRPEGRPAPERMFRRLDANRDGKVTLDEVPEPRREGFKRLIARGDKDGDSALSAAEFSAAFGEMPEKPPIGKRPEGRGEAAALFARLDKNGDGKLTVDETPEERRKLIARMLRRSDKDSDQALTLAEFLAGRERPDQAPPAEAAPGKRPGFRYSGRPVRPAGYRPRRQARGERTLGGR